MSLGDLNITPEEPDRTTHPVNIFEGLTLRGDIEGMWNTQDQALREWHQNRQDSDTVISMNTGGGKTLVGLLIAKSLLNELQQPTLYVCPTNQLVDQIKQMAAECSIPVATYKKGDWTNRDEFDEAQAPCITNYHAVFNGKSIFYDIDVSGLVFDDAHVAGDTIRSNYTLQLHHESAAAQEIITRVTPYFENNNWGRRLEEVKRGERARGGTLYLPMFEMQDFAGELRTLLVKHDVDEAPDTLFAWEHLKDHLNHCCLNIGRRGIEISPMCLPIHRLPYFEEGVRRVYLSATIPTPTELIRTFGIADPNRIQPTGKSGEAQRQFNFMLGEEDDAQRGRALQLTEDRKAAIIVPSKGRTDFWEPHGIVFQSDHGQERIDEFREADENDKMIFVARYDGIDLPKDDCQILVLDGLPRGEALIDRFIDEGLRISSRRQAKTAIRLIQAIGRIFRGNTDHGAVLICGTTLQRWFRAPTNRAHLPPLIQKQIEFGLRMREFVDSGETNFQELLEGVLQGTEEWDNQYSGFIDEAESDTVTAAPEWLVEITRREREAFEHLWEGRNYDSAESFGEIADEARQHEDSQLGAWYRHFEALATELAGDEDEAIKKYYEAAKGRTVLGQPEVDEEELIRSETAPTPGTQARRVASLYEERGNRIFKALDQVRDDLEYGEDKTDACEAAFSNLGNLLGLSPRRPDNEDDAGPDVIWTFEPKQQGVAIEAKTGKDQDSVYKKNDDIGQYMNHLQYLEDNHPEYQFARFIVGRELRVVPQSNPPPKLLVVPLEELKELTEKVRNVYSKLRAYDGDETLEERAERYFTALGLDWPKCISALNGTLATDLKNQNKDYGANDQSADTSTTPVSEEVAEADR